MEECKIKNLYNLEETMAKPLLEKFIYPWEALPEINDFIIPSKIEEDFVYDFYNRMDNYDYERIIKLLKGKVKIR